MVDWNAGAEKIFGYTAAEVIGSPITILVPADRLDEEEEFLSAGSAAKKSNNFETQRRRKDGEIMDISRHRLTVPGYDGHSLGATEIVRTSPAPNAPSRELQEREAHLRSVLDTVPDAMIIIDPPASSNPSASPPNGCLATRRPRRSARMSACSCRPLHEQHDAISPAICTTGERRIIGIGRVVIGRRRDGATFPMELSIGERQREAAVLHRLRARHYRAREGAAAPHVCRAS